MRVSGSARLAACGIPVAHSTQESCCSLSKGNLLRAQDPVLDLFLAFACANTR